MEEENLTEEDKERLEEFRKIQAKEMLKESFVKWDDNALELDKARIKLGEAYDLIKTILSKYMDIPEHYKTIISLWIIGTYQHKSFISFPYLFFNAMRGSGKTRMLKLISTLSKNGSLLASMREAVLFRTASEKTLCIDEFENINKKEKGELRELLNAAYKKGMKVQRMRKVKGIEGEKQVVEEFELYCPIAIANIFGMEEVLGDRCIQLVLEKSSSLHHTKRLEYFDEDPLITCCKAILSNWCSLCSVVMQKNTILGWDNYIDSNYTTLTTLHTYNTYNTLNTPNYTNNTKDLEFYIKLDKSGLDGRNLELFFPLFLIAKFLNEDILNEMLEIAKTMIKDKKLEETMDSKDVMLFDFISRINDEKEFKEVQQLTTSFRNYIGDEDDNEERWLNSRWMGRALKRLGLVLEKRRLGRGMDVILNKAKAEEKIKIFR